MPRTYFLRAAAFAVLMLGACADNDVPGNDRGAATAEPQPPAELANADEAINQAAPGKVYPGTLLPEEIASVIDPDSACRFAYTRAGYPVLAFAPAGTEGGSGVIKLNGKLMELDLQSADGAAAEMSAPGLQISVRRLDDSGPRRNAEFLFDLEGATLLRFHGFSDCPKQ